MVRVGVVGLGFMGKMHLKCYQSLKNAKVIAICDSDKDKFISKNEKVGNIAGAEKSLDLAGIGLYSDYDKMLAETKLDAVSITLPTYLHLQYTVKSLQAGINVLCEKPMALNLKDCDQMIAAAEKSGKRLQIGHCIRFWPEYAKTKEIIDSGEYGKVKAAAFRRLSLTPTWSWSNWLMNSARSGGAIFDLHIHDTDYVQYVFGMPKGVYARGSKGPSGDYDHVVTQYLYDRDFVITAEGGWIMTPHFGFEMSFNIILEKATISYDSTRKPAFRIYPVQADTFTPEVEHGDGYSLEIENFVNVVAGKKAVEVTTPQQSKNSVKIVEAERESADSGNKVLL